jgi:trigger factor
LALLEGCKHQLDITIPGTAFAAESDKVALEVQKKAHLKGFRPGKAPIGHVKSLYASDIRQEVLDKLIPKFLEEECTKENLHVVGRPTVKDLHFHDGEDVHFKVEFEVAPEIELKDVRGLKVAYAEPSVTDEDVEKRLNEIRESRAEFVNIDPRPAQDGDHVLMDLLSLSGVEGPAMEQKDVNIEVGGADTFQQFTDALRGAMPGDEREAEISYPENYAAEKLAGRSVKFKITLKSLRRKELPELNDEFAKDLGDFQTLEEVKEEIRKGMFREREYNAQTEAKNALIEKIVDMHEFPVPEAYVDGQVENTVRGQLGNLAAQGVDVSKLKLDWDKLRESQSERARRDVKASLLLDKIGAAESIYPTQEEVDQEVQRIAKQQREPVAAVRMKLEKDGTLSRIANRIRTEKVLGFLFDHAVKEAPAAEKSE